MLRLSSLVTVLLALACLTASSAAAVPGSRCGLPGYSYAGVGGNAVAAGLSADVRLVDRPRVAGGHVAAWVGFGGYGAGAGGKDAWVQAGIIAKAGTEPILYYEITRPGYAPRLVSLGRARLGRSYRITVRESPTRNGWWRIAVDGRQVTVPVSLPGSHRNWQPMVTAESWDGGTSSCNRFGFGFGDVAVQRVAGGDWLRFGGGFTLQDPGYRVVSRTPGNFLALS